MERKDAPKTQERQAEAQERQQRQRRIEAFLMLARNAQRAYDKRKQEEFDERERERQAWDETLAQIRRNLIQGYEFRFDR